LAFAPLHFNAFREMIVDEMDGADLPTNEWRFFLPGLGLVNRRQEAVLGPALPLIQKLQPDAMGSMQKPIRICIQKFPHAT
jgi:hypothetical protein